jgi:hypothetical protein
MRKQKKGYALIWSVLISAILLVISSTMANVIIKELNMSTREENSNNAYTAAKSGIDWANYYIHNKCQTGGWDGTIIDSGQPTPSISVPVQVNTGNFANASVTIHPANTNAGACDPNFDFGIITVISIGKYNNASREIKDTINSTSGYSPLTDITYTTAGYKFDMAKSSSMIFDYWPDAATTVTNAVGINDGTNSLVAVYDATGVSDSPPEIDFRLELINNTTGLPVTVNGQPDVGDNVPINYEPTPSSYLAPTSPLAFQVRIDYSQQLAARAEFFQRRSIANGYTLECLGSSIIDMSGINPALIPFQDSFYPGSGGSLKRVVDGNLPAACVGVPECVVLPTSSGYAVMRSQKGYTGAVPTTFTLTVNVNPAGAATPTGGGSFSPWTNHVAGFTITQPSHYVFKNWTGDCSSSSATSVSLLMDSNKTCTANFVTGTLVTLTANPAGWGTFTMNGASTSSFAYLPGSQAVLGTNQVSGYVFSGWNGGGCSGTGNCTITVGSTDINVTGNFSIPNVPSALTGHTGTNTCVNNATPDGTMSVLKDYTGASLPYLIETGNEDMSNSSNGCGTPTTWTNPANVLNSNGGSMYSSNGYDDSGTFIIDYGSPTSQISQVSFDIFQSGSATGTPKVAYVYTSTDGVNWTSVASFSWSSLPISFANYSASFAPTNYRFVKLYFCFDGQVTGAYVHIRNFVVQ